MNMHKWCPYSNDTRQMVVQVYCVLIFKIILFFHFFGDVTSINSDINFVVSF